MTRRQYRQGRVILNMSVYAFVGFTSHHHHLALLNILDLNLHCFGGLNNILFRFCKCRDNIYVESSKLDIP